MTAGVDLVTYATRRPHGATLPARAAPGRRTGLLLKRPPLHTQFFFDRQAGFHLTPPAIELFAADIAGGRALGRVRGHAEHFTLRRRPWFECRVELSVSELVALDGACRVWAREREGFQPSRISVPGWSHRRMRVELSDPRSVVERVPVPARAVDGEVMVVAELRVIDGQPSAGARAGVVYAMPGE